ncbi:MAG: TIGR03086 family protein, partial [Propionibacteriaceae bacterium]|nr:TIGR03086 family protein [Propionibacteriaceae bacterium]
MSPDTSETADLRGGLRLTLDWVGDLVTAVVPAQLANATPCAGWTVHDLLAHIVGVARRVAVIGQGADPFSVPSEITADADADWSDLFAQADTDIWSVWQDDATLTRLVTVPPGHQVDGATALGQYVTEFLVHGWDLATATGQVSEGPSPVAEAALAAARQFI